MLSSTCSLETEKNDCYATSVDFTNVKHDLLETNLKPVLNPNSKRGYWFFNAVKEPVQLIAVLLIAV